MFHSVEDATISKNYMIFKKIDGADVNINFSTIPNRSSWLRKQLQEEEGLPTPQEGYVPGISDSEGEEDEYEDEESEQESGDDIVDEVREAKRRKTEESGQEVEEMVLTKRQKKSE